MTTDGPGFHEAPPPPRPGDPAPDFALTERPGEPPFRLSEHVDEGPLVLLFFPQAFSPVCTEELCSAAEDVSGWESLGARAVAISVDAPFVLQRFARECGASFPFLSDFNREACTAYGVRDDDYFGMRGVAKRAVFVVGRDGRVAYSWVTDDDFVLPDLGEVRDAVRRAMEEG